MRTILAAIASCLAAAVAAAASTAPAVPPLLQSWSDPGLIAADDDWSRVPSVVGHRGDGLAAEPGTDPRTVLADGAATPVDVTANRTDPRAVGLAAGVAEFELANPVVAIQGSATAAAPHLVVALDTRGRRDVAVRLVLRDVDASGADAVSPVAVQYRVGSTGAFANAPAGYVADATSGPGKATLVTPVRVVLPPAANNRPLVQVRVLTTNAAGQDEWVGVDDIEATAAAGSTAPVPCSAPPPAPTPPKPPTPRPATPPIDISDLTVTPEAFPPSPRGAALVRRGGAALRFRLSRAARVRFTVFRAGGAPEDFAPKLGAANPAAVGGRSAGGRFSARGRRGLNRLRFSGRLRRKPLAPAEYVLSAVAVDRAGRESAPAAVRFRIQEESD